MRIVDATFVDLMALKANKRAGRPHPRHVRPVDVAVAGNAVLQCLRIEDARLTIA